MQLITCHAGRLHKLLVGPALPDIRLWQRGKVFTTGLGRLDELAPGGVFASGAVHELLSSAPDPPPLYMALLLAKGAAGKGAVVWCDPRREIYPPAIATAGIDLGRLFLLRPRTAQDQLWAMAECLRCKGVGAMIAAVGRLSRVEARRLQLASESGGSAGILLRPAGAVSSTYAAATRWLVEPAPGERTVQRWKIQLIHGHGGRIGQSVYLEHCRETNLVRALEKLADRSLAAEAFRASA